MVIPPAMRTTMRRRLTISAKMTGTLSWMGPAEALQGMTQVLESVVEFVSE